MIAYKYNNETFTYEGTQECQLDPLESKLAGRHIYLLPGNCTFEKPLLPKNRFNVVWNGKAWEYVEIPKPEEPEPEAIPEPEPEPETPKPTLEEIKQNKINELKFYRDAEEATEIVVDNYMFDFDEKSQNRIAMAINLYEDGSEVEWTLANNTTVKVTAEFLKLVQRAGAERSNKLHIRYKVYKEKVAEARTAKEVEAIVW